MAVRRQTVAPSRGFEPLRVVAEVAHGRACDLEEPKYEENALRGKATVRVIVKKEKRKKERNKHLNFLNVFEEPVDNHVEQTFFAWRLLNFDRV